MRKSSPNHMVWWRKDGRSWRFAKFSTYNISCNLTYRSDDAPGLDACNHARIFGCTCTLENRQVDHLGLINFSKVLNFGKVD